MLGEALRDSCSQRTAAYERKRRGDPGNRPAEVFEGWRRALRLPQVRGLVAGRALLYPPNGDVAGAVKAAAELVHG